MDVLNLSILMPACLMRVQSRSFMAASDWWDQHCANVRTTTEVTGLKGSLFPVCKSPLIWLRIAALGISVRSLNLYDVRLIRLQASRIYGHDWDGWVKESEPARAKQRQVASASHLPPACTAPCQQAWQMEYRHLKAARVRNAMP